MCPAYRGFTPAPGARSYANTTARPYKIHKRLPVLPLARGVGGGQKLSPPLQRVSQRIGFVVGATAPVANCEGSPPNFGKFNAIRGGGRRSYTRNRLLRHPLARRRPRGVGPERRKKNHHDPTHYRPDPLRRLPRLGRGRLYREPSDRAAGTTYPAAGVSRDIIAVMLGLVLYGAFVMKLHVWLMGVAPISA